MLTEQVWTAIGMAGLAREVDAIAETHKYLAFDLGASSGRAVLGQFDGCRMEMAEITRFPTPIIVEGERLYWDLEAVWTSLQEGLTKALEVAPDLCSVSVDSWGVDYVPLDDHMRPIRMAHVYRDPRAAPMANVANERKAPADLYAFTGIQAISINTLFQVLADQTLTPEEYRHTHCRLLIADYLNWRFCDRPVAEESLASTTQLLSPVTRNWSREAMRAMGIDPVTWPRVVPSGTVLGPVPEHPGVAVIAGSSHDTACAVAAVPAREDASWAYLSSGTWSLVGVERAQPLCTESARQAGFTNEIGFEGTTRLLKNITGLWVLQECERQWREAGMVFDYALLVDEARREPPAAHTIDFNAPQFGARCDMPARIAAACTSAQVNPPNGRGATVRLIFDSLAEMYRQTIVDLQALLGASLSTLHVVGGGSRNALLNQITADRCGLEVVAGPAEATALGNLLVQASTMGHLAPDQSIRDVARESVTTEVFRPTQSP